MSAYTEANFNSCLDAISTIKAQRDKAVRMADALIYREMTGKDMLLMERELSDLKAEIVIYHTRKKP
jgi:3-keto-L-gulonate-6-phosphate decarboxylase